MKERRITLTVPPGLEEEIRRINRGTGISLAILRKATEQVVFRQPNLSTEILQVVLANLEREAGRPYTVGTGLRHTDEELEQAKQEIEKPVVPEITIKPPTLKIGNLK